MKRLGIVAFMVVLILALVVVMREEPLAVDVVSIERGPLLVTIDEEGETRVRHRYLVSAPVTGRMLRLELEPGDAVVAGETVLARIEPLPSAPLDERARLAAEARVKAAEASLSQARAERERLRARLDFARSELARTKKLAEEQILPWDALESAETEVRAGERALNGATFAALAAGHELEVARAALGRTEAEDPGDVSELRSPVDGTLLRRLRESRGVVMAGEPIVEVGDLGGLEIVVDLLSVDAVKVEAGAPVLIERWGGDEVLHGRVRRVEPSGFTKVSALGVEEQRVNVIIEQAGGASWAELGDAYRIEVRIITWQSDDVLLAPTSALFRVGEGWAAFVVSAEGVVERREVSLGQSNGLDAELLSGLSAGDEVIVHPADDVQDGIEIVRREP